MRELELKYSRIAMLMDRVVCCFYEYVTCKYRSVMMFYLYVEIAYYEWILNDSISHRSLYKELINDNHMRISVVQIFKINN